VIEHPIVSVERTEKADFQLGFGFIINDFGMTSCFARLAIGLPAPIDHVDAAIRPEGIIRGDAFASFLEALLVTGNLIPTAEVLLQIDGLIWLWNGTVPDWVSGN